MAINQKRADKMKRMSPKQLEAIAKSGSLSSAAAIYALKQRKAA
jgi:hypothetical protein